ncbi:thermonuclease family protein [Zavarzinia compransoris]|uniref:thermonuclease family protein n=1 Tax=Zavarzinia marina TaxID=2911065 RepID=UPI001F2861A9|nr:thermonuclease family protein [Zavarzinia marina]MCF4164336.1 thermonuclease family protein [Zavarzinia marina]
MTRRFALPFILLAVLLGGAVAAGTLLTAPDRGLSRLPKEMPGPFFAEVIEVVDGDTMDVRVHIWLGQEVVTRVRLAGIDTPELRGECPAEKALAARARDMLSNLVAAGEVTLRDVAFDKYGGRVLARVTDGEGRALGERLIAAGLARPYDGKARAGWCD